MAYVAHKRRVRYVLRQGRKLKYVSKGTPGAESIIEESEDYYGFWMQGTKKCSIRFANCRDKAAAMTLLNRHLKNEARRKAGLEIEPEELEKSGRNVSLEEALVAFLANLRQMGKAPRYISEVERQSRHVIDALGARTLADLREDNVYQLLVGMDRSARTRETYRLAICGLTSWLVKPRVNRALVDPLAAMEPFKGEAVRQRRALTPEELQRLLDAARERPLANATTIRKGHKRGEPFELPSTKVEELRFAGYQRALVYKTAVLTLSRFGAIRLLTVDALHLDATPAHAYFPPRNVKKKRPIYKALHPTLVEDLKEWLRITGKKRQDRVFALNSQITRELRKDLAFAGIPYKDSLGRTFDFHAFKKSSITALARAHVDLLAAKDMAEHEDPRLTSTVYRDALGQPMEQVFAGMPQLK